MKIILRGLSGFVLIRLLMLRMIILRRVMFI